MTSVVVARRRVVLGHPTRRMVLGRVLALVPTLLLATFGIFFLIQLAPGDPAIALAGENATATRIAEIRRQQGFDRPLLAQYWTWLTHAVRGDLGVSITTRESVLSAVGRTLPTTVQLVVAGLVVAAVLGVIAGVASARRANTAADAVISSVSSAGAAMPSFWLGLVLVSVFALRVHWFPATGFVGIWSDPGQALRYLVLPAIALGVSGAAEIARQLRAVLIEILASDHIRTLHAKGLAEWRIVWIHALKAAAVPLVTIVGLQVSRFLGATVVVEAVFGIAGIGTLVVGAAQNRDYPVVEGVVIVLALIVVVINFAVDLSYRVFDPRIR
jgi:peptide/nickel transport system permease protein